MNIFISNLSYQTVDSELRTLFEKYGTVESVTIITNKNTGRSRGMAFVEMLNDDEAEKAIRRLNNSKFKARPLNVEVAIEREPREEREPRKRVEREPRQRRKDW